ncbi:MAG: flippase-like domain-containing protein [Candidatus Nanopelagicales bacterium]
MTGTQDVKRTRSFLTAAHEQPRARRAASITTIVVGVVFVAWGILVHGLTEPLQTALTSFAAALPEWGVALLAFGYTLGLLYALFLLIVFVARRRWTALRDVVIAGAAASLVTLVLVALDDGLWPQFFTEFVQGEPRPQFPVVRVALVVAVLVAASPYLARPLRRIGWIIVVIISAAALALGLSVPAGIVVALGVGLIAAGAVMVIFGSPQGYPDVPGVADALARIGVDIPDLHIAHDQSWGVRRLVGHATDGTEVEVKAYGRDAMDSQLAAKAWHALMYRGGGRQMTFSRIQSVEHEALTTMLAGRAGVSVPQVVAAAAATDEVAALVTTRSGVALADLGDPDRLADDSLVQVWRDVARMHAAGITHGSLTAEALRVTDDGHVIAEWESGSVVLQDSDAALDIVHLLFATAGAVGVERAVAAASDGLGAEKLTTCLGYLQPPALTSRERRSVKGAGKQLKALRDEIAKVTDTEAPEPVKLRRLDARTIVTLVLILMFASALLPMLAGIDYAEIGASLAGANWWIGALAILAGQLAFLPQGTAMMSAVGRAIPLRPMTILQPAVAFISFAVPGMAGRVTMESAFLYKYGIPPTVSVTKGAVDAFSGFLVQLALLLLAFLTGALAPAPGAAPDSSSSRSVSWAVIVIVVLLAVAVVVAVWRVEKIHNRVVPEIQKAWGSLTEVLKSPILTLGLLGSQLAVQLLWGLALWLALLALGVHLNLITCTAVVVATALLQGVIPVPGGIGVSEAVMSAFLVPLGVSGAVAMGATVIWRIATFYLPATEGFFASRYLQKRGYL